VDNILFSALNRLYQIDLSSRDQLLNEMLRVKTILKNLGNDYDVLADKAELFQFMKSNTEADFGFFPADREDFADIFTALKDIDLIDFTLEIYKDDRTGTIISRSYLNSLISEKMGQIQPQKILIAEAEKHLSGLREMIDKFPNLEFTLTTELRPMKVLLDLALGDRDNVKIHFESIYSEFLTGAKFDYIYSLPQFGGKIDHLGNVFLTRDTDGIAIENMLRHLNDEGVLDIIVPARVTFARMGFERLRSYISKNYAVKSIYILPEGTFRPATNVKTYLLTITAKPQSTVQLGTLELNNDQLNVRDKSEITTKEFLEHEDWRIELLLSDNNEYIRRYKNSGVEKVKLKEVAEVFRGKSILKKDTAPGNISVLNISNIEDGEIDYSNLDTIDEEERKVKRYELEAGDVVLSCRGTAIKSAVFKKQINPVIASANLIVIRPKERVKGEFIKIFFESPIGLALIKSLQRGSVVMNINHTDIMEIEIPLLPTDHQEEIVKKYYQEFVAYKNAVSKAEQRWKKIKDTIYNGLV